MEADKISVKKKNGSSEPFNRAKINCAIRKSADRVLLDLSDEDCLKVSNIVLEKISEPEVSVRKLHKLVELALDEAGFSKVAESYRQYRNYKIDAQKILEAVDAKVLELSYKADKSNANCDSALVSTKRSLIYGEQQKERYKRLFLNEKEREAAADGFLYYHDSNARLDATNCELVNYGRIMKGGFILSGIEYSEPGSVGAAIAVLSDLMSTVSGNTYGGNTAPEIDTILAPYCEKSYNFYKNQYLSIVEQNETVFGKYWKKIKQIFGKTYDAKLEDAADKFAEERVRREISQQMQGIEHTFNSVSSSRGDFPFTTFTFGHDKSKWAAIVSSTILSVRKGGQGKAGHKIPVVFPKLVFIYDSELHGPGKELEWLFKEAVECTKIAQYPDYLSVDKSSDPNVPNYVGEVYHKWGKIISPMGKCKL